jgi:hypothetical protein
MIVYACFVVGIVHDFGGDGMISFEQTKKDRLGKIM